MARDGAWPVMKLNEIRAVLRPSRIGAVRLVLLVTLAVELAVTALVQRPDLLQPSTIGSDPSNYLAAGLRLNDGHPLYGPLQAGDRRVPGYPRTFPAPLLSPPLSAVIWRPLALLPGSLSMYLWSLGGLLILMGLAAAFTIVGKLRNLILIGAVLALGVPLALIAARPYPYPGYDSPISIAALSGNLNAYIVALFAVTWWASSRDRPWIAGFAAALATALKLGPLVLLWWFVTQRWWRTSRGFVVALAALGVVGVTFAGLQANIDFVHLAVGGGVRPTALSVPGMLHRLFKVSTETVRYGTTVALVLGLAAIFALRRYPRAAFAVAILTTIYASPVVLQGNFALLIAAAAPWVTAHPARGDPDPLFRPRPGGDGRLRNVDHRSAAQLLRLQRLRARRESTSQAPPTTHSRQPPGVPASRLPVRSLAVRSRRPTVGHSGSTD